MRLTPWLIFGVLATVGCKPYYDVTSACADNLSGDSKLTPLERDGLSRINCYRRMVGVARVAGNPVVQTAADGEVSYVQQNPDYDQLFGSLGPVYWLAQQSDYPGYTGSNVYERLTASPDRGGAGYVFADLGTTSYWEFIFVDLSDNEEDLHDGADAVDFLMRFPEFRQVALQPSWLDGAFTQADLSQQWFADGGFGALGGGTTSEGGGGASGTVGTTVDISNAPFGRVYYMVVIYTAPHFEHASSPVLLPRKDETDVPQYGWSTNRNVIQGDGTYAPVQLSYPVTMLMGAIDPANYSAVDQNQYNAQITAASIVGPEGPLITHVVHPGDDAVDIWPSGRLMRTTLSIYANKPFDASTHYDVYANYTTPEGEYSLKYGFRTRTSDEGVDPAVGRTIATTGTSTARRAQDESLEAPFPTVMPGAVSGTFALEPGADPVIGAILSGAAYVGFAYLVAAIPFGVVVTTLFGGDQDIRNAGSGNIGATNVARVYGWRLAGAVIALDVAKGYVPVQIARWGWPHLGLWWPGLVLITCFLAHCFPVYLEFRGGKGVATGAGGLLALSPWATLPAAAIWITTLGLTGRSSVAALTATAMVVVVSGLLDPHLLPIVGLLGAGILATHVPNLRRLYRGEEGTVVRPVRWGRASAVDPDPEQLLHQGPTGGPPVPVWREEAISER